MSVTPLMSAVTLIALLMLIGAACSLSLHEWPVHPEAPGLFRVYVQESHVDRANRERARAEQRRRSSVQAP